MPRAAVLFALLFWSLLAAPAMGDELSSWFASDPRALPYAAVQGELAELLSAARLRGVPIGPLIDKLREGASKGVAGEVLLGALRGTIDRLIRARAILEQASGTAAGSEEDVQAVSLLLQRGLHDELARELIAYGLQAGRGMQAIRAACDSVTGLLEIQGLGDQQALKVGTLLLASRLPVSAYGLLASVYLKARAYGLQDSEILSEVIIGTLESGGGIVSMDEKINRGQAAKAERESANQPAGPPGGPPGRSGQPPGKGHDKKK